MRWGTIALGLGVMACGDAATGSTAGDVDAGSEVEATSAETDGTQGNDASPDTHEALDTTVAETSNDVPVEIDASGGAIDLYDPDRLHEVAIVIDEAAWDTLRHETRSIVQILGPDCLVGPPEDVFTWQRADVTIDGATVAGAGIRKKGFLGSLDEERPALRIEADHFVSGARFGDDLEHVTLNNGRQDPSRLRQCLAYETFRAAGIAAPRCSFAHVTVNGRDLGLYVNVEPVKKRFLRAAFGEDAPAADRPEGLGQLWEGTLSDFRDGWLGTFEEKLDEPPAAKAPLQAVIEALAASDEALLDALDQVIDLDRFITFWATEVLVAHWDGYAGNTNNFFVYHAADGRLAFIPWGVDGTFVDLAARGPERPASLLAVGAIAHRLAAHPVGRARFQAELVRLLDDVWDEAALIDRIARWDALTFDAREPGSGQEGSQAVAALKLFVQGRRAAITAELADPPAWPDDLRAPLCAKPQGTITGALATTWGTLPIEDIFRTGTGALAIDSDTLPPLTFGAIGSKAGENPDAPGRAELVLAAQVIGAGFVAIVFRTPLPPAPGERPIEGATEGWVYYLEPPDRIQLIGFLGEGALVLEEAGASPDDPIEATFEAVLLTL